MIKRLSILSVLLLLLTGAFSACRPKSLTEDTTVVTSAITDETTEVAEKKDVFIPSEAVTIIEKCDPNRHPQLAALSSELLLESESYIKEDFITSQTVLKTVNMRTGEPVSQAVFDGRLNIEQNACDEYCILLRNFSEDSYVTCNADLTDKKEIFFGTEDYAPGFLPGSRCVKVFNGCLTVTSPGENENNLLNEFSVPAYMYNIDCVDRNEISFISLSESGEKEYNIHIDADTGKTKAIYPYDYGQWIPSDGRYYRFSSGNFEKQPTIEFTDKDGNIFQYKLNGYDAEVSVSYIENSPYFCVQVLNGGITLLRPENDGTVWAFPIDGISGGNVFYPDYISDSGCFVMEVLPYDGGPSVYLINPALLKGEKIGKGECFGRNIIDQTALEKLRTRASVPSCPDYLSEIRKKADELEKNFGIKVLLSEQCRNVCEQLVASDEKYNEVTPTNFSGDSKWEKTVLDEFLKKLDKTLSKFPEGMFLQFIGMNGSGGIRIVPVAKFDSKNRTAGLTSNNSGWYNIFVLADGGNTDINETLCHEMWHAVEYRIEMRNPKAFNEESWNGFNPDGYTYKGYDNYKGKQYNFGDDSAENTYFAREYGQADVLEDRASIFEKIAGNDENTAKSILKCPHIKAKFDCMCEAVCTAFDTSSWRTPFRDYFNS